LSTGEARFRIVGRQDTNPAVFWALVVFWAWMLVGSLAYALLIISARLQSG
jgi:hypothetical protein